jgi:16S rRNA (cytosine967-C5)-methyltransferase
MLAIRRRRIAFYFRMSRYISYLHSAIEIISAYNGEEPFASFLKKYFAKYKKYGSKDRKHISHLCYCYFRLGKALSDFPADERILIGLFLCSSQRNDVLEALRPTWNEKVSLSVADKCLMLNVQHSTLSLFPFTDQLSEGIESEQFILSHLQQPDLFLRLRPGKETGVKRKLKNADIPFVQITDTCIALPNSSKVEDIIELNREAVVQDHSSQQVGAFLLLPSSGRPLSVWDCCAASGGKSIMLYDLEPTIKLTASDIRESILVNLRKRFHEAGIKGYHSFIADLTKPLSNVKLPPFDLIICDGPCSGSGTWGRTPEQLSWFEKSRIDEYALLQKKIVSNTIPHVKPGGYFLYITCSVFKKENEEVVESIEKDFAFELVKMEVIKGYDKKADTMFAALLRRPL